MLMQTTLLFATVLICQTHRDQYVPLSGTVVSGVAGYYNQREFVGAANATLYCANGKFDGAFFRWLAVWDEDQTSASRNYLGGFHFYHPHELGEGISLIYQSTCGEKSDGTTPAFFSRSFETKTIERKGQKGKRCEVKARLVLHATDTSFASVDVAIATILEIAKAHFAAMRLRIPPRKHDGKAAEPEESDDAERAACAAIESESRLVIALLGKDKMSDAKDMRSRLVKLFEAGKFRMSKDLADLFRRCVLDNKELWEKGPDTKLLEQESERWRAYRQLRPAG
jgi:hypothetical protein